MSSLSENTTSNDDAAKSAGVMPPDQDFDSGSGLAVHPWPYLSSLFAFCSESDNTYRFRCLLCTPKVTKCSAYRNSPSNLKKHIARIHPEHHQEYDQLAAGSRKRKAGI